uniref:Rh blood group, D antigen n=1 Tax=Nothobranchius furzeri TaxID=105023 RepID=A0A8C6NW89_NOTFU
MAPQYAPSLRSRLAPLLLCLQTLFIIISALYFKNRVTVNKDDLRNFYSEFQDVNVMVILGFGFLSTFLVRHGFSSTGFNLLVAAIASQWALILTGVESWFSAGRITVDLKSIVVAELCTASALIAVGSVLGKANPVQLTVIVLLEVSGFVLNEWLLRTLLKVRPLSSIMLLHIFGALFGLTLTWIMYRKGSEDGFEKEKFDRKSGLFSSLGTVFLWMFWPSFNSVLVPDWTPWRKLGAVSSTYLALAVSAVTAAAVSVLCSPKGKLNLIQMQSCILAGGVAVGVSMSAVHEPWEAMAIGFTAAIVSTIGFKYLKVLHHQKHFTFTLINTNFIPTVMITRATRFAVFHICTLFITISLSVSMGFLTGFLIKWNFCRPLQNKKCFDDQAFWEFPHLAAHK